MEASRACPLSVGNGSNGRNGSTAAVAPSGTTVTNLPDSTSVPIVTSVTSVTGVTRWRLIASPICDPDTVSSVALDLDLDLEDTARSIFAPNEGRQSFSLPAAVVQFALDLQRTDATMLALSLAGWFL